MSVAKNPLLLAAALYLTGELLAAGAPGLQTSGPQLLVWGFFVSTVVLLHGTLILNSLDHMFGSRRNNTPDTGRNPIWLALLALGEGWHNNHHHHAVSTRQGFFWWEVDITYYLQLLLSRMGIIYDLGNMPERVRRQHSDLKKIKRSWYFKKRSNAHANRRRGSGDIRPGDRFFAMRRS